MHLRLGIDRTICDVFHNLFCGFPHAPTPLPHPAGPRAARARNACVQAAHRARSCSMTTPTVHPLSSCSGAAERAQAGTVASRGRRRRLVGGRQEEAGARDWKGEG